jgi:glycosyltransferase involved in cell wall biosynthesis
MNRNMKLVFFVTEDWYFCSHRLSLAIAAKEAGYEVTVVTRVKNHGERIRTAGLNLIPLDLSRRGINPFTELKIIFRLISIYKSERPVIVHHVALKPVLYGAIAVYFAKVPFMVNALAGLGFLFSSKDYKAKIMQPFIIFLFGLIFNRKNCQLILQNPDDVSILKEIVIENNISLIRGSGVDMNKFTIQPEPTGTPIIILASRLLWDKGVGEFVKAAEILKEKKIEARFVLIGSNDSDNPSSIPEKQLIIWDNEKNIEWWGHKSNMAEIFAQSTIVCLPSTYGEGVPKVLIEAAACGKPIVTTDSPGCREIVKDRVNGILVPIKDAYAVASAVLELIEQPNLRKEMGIKGRDLVLNEFSVGEVIRKTLEVYAALQKL